MIRPLLQVTALACAANGIAAGGSIIHVDANLTTGANDGTSWADAFRGRLGLKNALAASAAGSEVWVADGVYAPGSATASPSVSLQIPSGVAVLGGFAGGESAAAQRDPAMNIAVLSGDLLQDDGKGVWDHTLDNSWHVVRITNGAPATVLDGFTIRDALAWNGQVDLDTIGGGLLIEGGEPSVRRCFFTDSRAEQGAAIAVIDAGHPVIEDCVFKANVSGWRGAGISLDVGCDATVRRCQFEENQGSNGVGMFLLGAAPVIEDCDFIRNTSPISAPSGAGIGGAEGASPIIRRCRFIENQSQGGGGVHLVNAQATISRCRFVANIGTGDGGDAVVLFGGDSNISNCEFIGTGDRTDLDPSGVLLIIVQGSGTHSIVNCTFANNGNSGGSAGPFSGHAAIIAGNDGLIRFKNCLIWGNFSAFGGGQIASVDDFGSPVFDRCLVQGWDGTLDGVGSFSLDPIYVDADGADTVRGTIDDDVRLASGSPGIDAGINAAVPAGEAFDVAGLPRFRDDPATPDTGVGSAPIVDLGSHEVQPPPCAGDANSDGAVDFGDITFILANWGSPFGFADVTLALANWGGC